MAKVSIAELTAQFDQLIQKERELLGIHQQLQKSPGGKNFKEYVADTEKLKNNTIQLTNVERERLKVQKQIKDTFTKAITANEHQNRVLDKGKILLRESNKLRRQQIEIERLQTKEGQRLNQQLREQGAQLKKLRGVGSGLVAQVRNLALAYIGLQAAMRFIKNTVKTIIDFQKAQSSLLAISGKTRKELEGLTKQAKSLGATTEFTATQVTGLQIELAKLGFTVNEISLSTKDILNFASATGADLSAAAKTAGIALRAFGLDATKMRDVVSTLAVATTKSALTFEDYDTILSNAGPVFKAYGFKLEELIALSGKLADAGFDASKGSTALRNIMLNLADTSKPLAKALGGVVRNSDDLIDGLKKLKSEGYDLNETLQLTDKRSVAAFNTFMQSAEGARELRDGISGVNDELQIMVDKKLDNLAGDVTKLSSAWEGFILKGEGGVNAFRYIIQFLNDLVLELANLDLIFTRSSKLTVEQVERTYDVLLALTNKQGKAFQDLIKFSNDVVYESVITQGKGFEEQLEKAGFTAEESALLWDEYLKRRELQYLAEIKAAEDAAAAKVEAEKSAINKIDREQEKSDNKQEKEDEKQGEKTLKSILERLNREKEYQQTSLANHEKYLKDKGDAEEESEEERKARDEKEKEAFYKKIELYSSIAEDIGSIIGEFVANSEISFKQFSKVLLVTALEFIKKQILLMRMKVTAESLASAESVATFGIAGLAKAAIINGLISAAFAGVETAIMKFHEGEIDIRGQGKEFPAILKTGESVINPESTQRRKHLLTAVNSDLSDSEIFNAMLKDSGQVMTSQTFTDERLIKLMQENNRHTKKLLEIEENRPHYDYDKNGNRVIKTKHGEIIIRE